jgi:quercetin dioxygenase-like cupin family protein
LASDPDSETVEPASEGLGEPVRPCALLPGEGLSVENPMGGVLTFKMMGSQSDGALTAIETTVAPGEGPPLHVHDDEDELIFILDGTFRIKLGAMIHQAPPGSFVFIPRHTPHTWQNIGESPARFFATVMPAAVAFEQFFIRYAELPVNSEGSRRSPVLPPRLGHFR